MRVAIDAHALGRGQAGYESYLRHLTTELPWVAPDIQFLLYRDLPAGRLQRLCWALPLKLMRDRPELLHVQYVAPFPCVTPIVATIHDLSFIDVPQFFAPVERALLKIAVGRTARLARRIVTVSEFSKRRLMEVYQLAGDRVVVAPNAAGPQFTPAPSMRNGPPYILMVGDLQPRKNHIGAIRAFAAFAAGASSARATGGRPIDPAAYRFVIAGRKTPFTAEIVREAAASGVGDRIDILGYVPDEDLPNLYRHADACIYPSFYEGFGLPVLEAMACGTPVVTSNNTALQEVAGGAAILADPNDPREIAQAIASAIARRAELREAGIARSHEFSWKESATRTASAFRAALQPHAEGRLVTA